MITGQAPTFMFGNHTSSLLPLHSYLFTLTSSLLSPLSSLFTPHLSRLYIKKEVFAPFYLLKALDSRKKTLYLQSIVICTRVP